MLGLEPTSLVEEPFTPDAYAALSNGTAYALFTRAILPGVSASTIDVTTGRVTARHVVTGPFASYLGGFYGEGTRLLEWSPFLRKFFTADVDLGGGAGNETSPIVLFAVDPTDGSSTATRVTGGARGYPIGQAWDESMRRMVITTQDAKARTVSFYTVDVATAVATGLGSLARGTSESSSPAYYSAYVSHAGGGAAYRVGHQIVSTGKQFGVSEVKLSTSRSPAVPHDATGLGATWHALAWSTHDLPASMHTAPGTAGAEGGQLGGGSFVSLAPRKKDGPLGGAPAYDIVTWRTGAADVKVVANLSNAHPPTVPLIHKLLGYVGASLAASTYAALTVASHPSIIPGAGDKWSLSVIDLAAPDVGASLIQVPLQPQPSPEGAETVALSGFGLAGPAW